MKFPENAPIEAKLLFRQPVQWNAYNEHNGKYGNADGIVALIETDGQLVAIKGIAWEVPEMAVLPLNSIVRFEVNARGEVKKMELVKAPTSASAESSQDLT
jgi:hypothetical protein